MGRHRRPVDAPLICLLLSAAALTVAGCGGTSHHTTTTTAKATSADTGTTATTSTAVSATSPAKRRYLSHFSVDCTQADKLTNDLQSQLNKLIGSAENGNKQALSKLAALFHRIASALNTGLKKDNALGTPPNPDSKDAQRYLADVEVTAFAFQKIGDGLAVGNLQVVNAAEKVIADANKSVSAAAKRYGIPTCGPASGSSSSGPSVPAI
jgi:hypothetical protein